jgi:hypothetical protein
MSATWVLLVLSLSPLLIISSIGNRIIINDNAPTVL